ncbi:MAG: hypothetical protein NC314_11270 [Roseburia sp.]|nr:hypothetical protein [Ruminococcus sp.]MCM1154732.1 hypothetical protein [Roseburia sp.]MCM1243411.1 hypothetical protein [Roseburia sp.]
MTGDFTNLDPNIIASFWIYFISSFVIGLLVGFFVAKAFFHRERRIVNQEKEHCKEQETEMVNLKVELQKKNEELVTLKKEFSNDKLYWAMKEKTDKQNPADEALFNSVFQQKDR